MGYVAVKAGEELIERAEVLFEKQRLEGDTDPVAVDQLDEQLGRLTDQAAGEGGLYAPRLAALAVKQAQGDTVEAAFLLQAYRSTLERWEETDPVSPDEMDARRRVSPAYKDVPGGQMLGATKDYTRRLLDFDLLEEGRRTGEDGSEEPDEEEGQGLAATAADEEPLELTNVMDLLRERGLVREPSGEPPEEPSDTTREPVTYPPERDEVLQELARGETGAITALGYSSLRGYGQVHPTLAEVRVGRLPVRVEHPYTGEPVRVTDATVTECEAVVPVFEKREQPAFAFGYGLTFGRNERKAIGMSVLDAAIQLDSEAEPAENPEFVLDTVDGLDSFGFIEHLKLPHYVTFQSILDRIESIRDGGGPDPDREPESESGSDSDAEPEEPAAAGERGQGGEADD